MEKEIKNAISAKLLQINEIKGVNEFIENSNSEYLFPQAQVSFLNGTDETNETNGKQTSLNFEITIITDFENDNVNLIENNNLDLINLIKNKFNENKIFHENIIYSNFDSWNIINNEELGQKKIISMILNVLTETQNYVG